MTDAELGINRITAGVFRHPEEMKITDLGAVWNPHFIERVQDATKLFQEMFYDRIVAEIGDTGWAIRFTQVSQESVHWFVDTYVDDKEHFNKIVAIVNKYIPPDFQLGFWYQGLVAAYIGIQ